MGADQLINLADLAETTEFRDPHEYDDGRGVLALAMRYVPREVEGWDETAKQWLTLPSHPNVLGALARDEQGLVVRHAAINWKHGPSRLGNPKSLTKVAGWGVQLAEALTFVVLHVEPTAAAWLSRPEAYVDLDDNLRLAFLPASPADPLALYLWPDDVRRSWPACDERGFVYLVGKTLSRLFIRGDTEEARRLNAIVQRCLAPSPHDRFETLAALRWEFLELYWRASPLDRRCWDHTELGIGFLAIQNYDRAAKQFESALSYDRWAQLASRGLARAVELGRMHRSRDLRDHLPPLIWADVQAKAAKLEAARDFASALDIYRRTILDRVCDLVVLTATARCHLHLGEAGHATDYAQRALLIDGTHAEALAIRVRGQLMGQRFEDALQATERWLTIDVDRGNAHYLRGKAMLPLKRLVEARDCFDRALAADPRMVPAMLLRREADRQLTEIRDATGVQRPIEIPIPTHLPELKPLFASGRTEDAITLLASERYTDDPVALLLLAACLDFAQRFKEAADVYERVAARGPEHRHAALLGRAGMLVELGDPDGALDLLDALRTKRPDDLDIIEGRAWVLDRLGRADESQAEFRRYVALNQGSARRAGWIRRQR